MELGTAVASAWSSGISMYLVMAVVGIGGRLDWLDAPELLTRPWVIAVALVMFVVELVVDKIAWLDSGWDAVHTFLRPVAGAYMLGGAQVDGGSPVALAAAGGLLALSSHSAKAATRAFVNASPEPVSNVVVSFSEDGLVGALMALALTYPEVALAVTLVLAVASTVVAVVMFHAVRRLVRRFRRWRSARRARGQAGRWRDTA